MMLNEVLRPVFSDTNFSDIIYEIADYLGYRGNVSERQLINIINKDLFLWWRQFALV